MLRDVAMATNFVTQFAIIVAFWFLVGYSCGCMIASDTMFDSRGGFNSHLMKTCRAGMSKGHCYGNQLGTKVAITGFVRMIMTKQLVMEVGLSVQLIDC